MEIIQLPKWDRRWLELAQYISKWSKDPSTQVGAVIARENKLISLGYNGFPEGIDDSPGSFNLKTEGLKMINSVISQAIEKTAKIFK